MDWLHVVAGLFVGLMVGMTGVGGGSLMAPILILLFGVSPTTAVGTDLWFAAITKSVGGVVHHRHGGAEGGPDYLVVKRLCYGSIPAALVVIAILSQFHVGQIKSGIISTALGIVLLATAVVTLLRGRFHRWMLARDVRTAQRFTRWQPALTIAAGALLGAMVTLTSVGAGAIGATMLLALYPVRMRLQRLVATDIVHAVPLTLVAGLGHLWIGNVNPVLLVNLLAGSLPGIVIGSILATRSSDKLLQPVLAAVLLVVGWRLIF